MVDGDGQATLWQAKSEFEFGVEFRERGDVEALGGAQLQVGVAVVVPFQASLAEEPGLAFAEGVMDLGDATRECAIHGRHHEDGGVVGFAERARHGDERDFGMRWKRLALGCRESPEAPVQRFTRLAKILRDTFGLEDFSGGEEIPITETVRRKASPQHEASASHRRQTRGING